jgi:phage terminase large subunit GpA-like protein
LVITTQNTAVGGVSVLRRPCNPWRFCDQRYQPAFKTADWQTEQKQPLWAAGLYPLGVDTAKEVIYSRLKITEPGAGYYHFPQDRDREYFLQLTAEKQVTRFTKRMPKREWL